MLALALFALAPATHATLITPEDVYQTNYHFTLAGSPYIIDGSVYFRGGTLIFDADVVVKFRTATSSLTIHGDAHVESRATKEHPVFFTSYKDDERGGDTNSDGNATTPAPGDWAFLSIGCGTRFGSDILDHFHVSYGGAPQAGAPNQRAFEVCYNRYGGPQNTYALQNVEVADNLNGLFIRNTGHIVTVSNSSIHGNTAYGADAYRGQSGGHWWYSDTDFANNWWGSTLGPQSQDNPGNGDIVLGEFNTLPFLEEDPLEVEQSEPDPVIVIPGILGSRLKNNVWTLDPVLHTYDNLVETLAGNGYTYDQTLFTFPYDWTQSNEITAGELKAKVDAVKAQTRASKVDIVAHSMGGLIAREYIQSSGYEGDVDQLIFLGTPHLGAPLAYLMYEGGEADGTVEGFFFGLYLDHLAYEAGFANTFDYLHLGHVTSVRQLLPVYDYLFDETNNLLDYPDRYPTNPFLEDLSSTSDQLALSGVEITNIIGDDGENGTLNSLNIKPSTELPRWLHGMPTNLNRGEGDKTVPFASAAPSFIDSSITPSSVEGKPPLQGVRLE